MSLPTYEEVSATRFYQDLERDRDDLKKLVTTLEGELTIQRGRVAAWQKDSGIKEKLLNEKCQRVALLEGLLTRWINDTDAYPADSELADDTKAALAAR